MAYIWINPVTDSMYATDVLNEFLCQYGLKRIQTFIDWRKVVKEKYGVAVAQATHPVVDMRCPKIKELLDELGVTSAVTSPEIEPILIHCARECSKREELSGEEKIITTPCQALADMGNRLGLKDTWFVPWNRLVEALGGGPECIPQKASPIPPGFFTDLGLRTESISGEEEIRNYFQNGIANEVQLIEMLFCQKGCHNGDGVMCRGE